MKNNVLSFLAGAILMISFSFLPKESSNKSLATVQKQQGKYVFLFCEPVAEYEIVDQWVCTVNLSGGSILQDNADELLKDAFKRAKKKGYEFDAVISGSAAKDLAVKFK